VLVKQLTTNQEQMTNDKKSTLLIAASGTGGHLFPALAVAEQLPDYQIEWLGVANRLETSLVPPCYPLHPIDIEGFQTGLGVKTLLVAGRIVTAIARVKRMLKQRKIKAVFTTGGYIAAPAILAAKIAKIPVILHESNFIPGKVTKWLGSWCHTVAVGFEGTAKYLPQANTIWINTPVRSQFRTLQPLNLPIPQDTPLIVVMGGSQGAVALNRLVRQCAPSWLAVGAMVVHLTGDKDPDVGSLEHSQYLQMPFYDQMAGLLQRANLAISRAGAGTLTELAVTHTPAILIPYPFAAEDHQYYNAKVFAEAGAAYLYRQEELSPELLEKKVLQLLNNPDKLREMANKAASLGSNNSANILANLLRKIS
jgi:UDP-N-acetylglucosamine--N-acetylmuramyl-(pentapeptide) pyrophosphoryl-undecaprenol N-acetylglucosamine transferase